MPKRHRQRTMKGGFLDTLSSWGSSLTQSASNLWEKTKSATSNLTNTSSSSQQPDTYSSTPSATSYSTSQPMTTSTYGGRKRSRRMRGGFKDNTGSSQLAANAAPFSGVTAKPHNYVGGKTKRHKKHRHSKSCKHKKH